MRRVAPFLLFSALMCMVAGSAGAQDTPSVLVAKVDKGEKQLLMEAEPEVFFETPHYEGYGYFLVRLENIEEDELAEVLEDAWRLAAPKRLVAERDEAA